MLVVKVLVVRTVNGAVTGAGTDLTSVSVIFPGLMVLVFTTPGVLPVLLVTKTVITQGVPRTIVPLVREIVVPATGLDNTELTPQPVFVGAVELLIVKSPGRLSVTEKLDKSVSAGALIVILSLEF